MSASGVANWREIVERHRTSLMDDLAAHLDTEIRDAVASAVLAERQIALERVETAKREATAKAVEKTRRLIAESLNQSLRRFRHLPAQGPVYQLLVDASAPYASQVAVAVVEGETFRVVASRGLPGSETDAIESSWSVADAAAVAATIESRDPVVALATEAELSAPLSRLVSRETGHASDDAKHDSKAYLFPVLCRSEVFAVMVASGPVSAAPLEVLCEAAGLKIEALVPESTAQLAPLKSAGLVHISGVASTPIPPTPSATSDPGPESNPVVPVARSDRRSWDQLTPDEQRLHLKAQRVARVKIAEIRLYNAAALGKGTFAGDIYGALRSEIDAARTEFLQSYLSKSATMVDYLHLEIMRSLANEDERLLGSDYPGPMV